MSGKLKKITAYTGASLLLFGLFYFSVISGLGTSANKHGVAGSGGRGQEQQVHFQRLNMNEKLKLLIKDTDNRNYFRIEEDGVAFFASAEDKAANRVEFKIYYDEKYAFEDLMAFYPSDSLGLLFTRKGTERLPGVPVREKSPVLLANDSKMPLRGVRIALDPGHLGGSMQMAMLENKFVRIRYQGQVKEFNEGNLNLATALLLKQQLERLGAEVMLTRYKEGWSAFDKTWPQWLKEDFKKALAAERRRGNITTGQARFLAKASEQVIYHQLFKGLEIRERAKKINRFQPDFTLVIHYNIHEPNFHNRLADESILPATENYCMAFVPGSFLKGELKTTEERIALARMLLTDELERSIALSQGIMQSHTELLQIPPVSPDAPLGYLQHNSIATEAVAVYARNLALTRMVNGPICYGESLCQDSSEEFLQFATSDGSTRLAMRLPRLQQVTTAYLNGILGYLGVQYEPAPAFFQ